jgi:hypothetical protein
MALTSLMLTLMAGATLAHAQQGPIQDNSFLIEEAYNQDPGYVQHISAFSHYASSGGWLYTFTQEWPLGGVKHQLSYTLPVQDVNSELAAAVGLGDVALNYRYQALGDSDSKVAFAPRLSLLVPTGKWREGLGSGGVGLQLSLPLSWVWSSRVVTHWNAGITHTFSAHDETGDEAGTNALNLGQSFVWLAARRVNLLLETVYVHSQDVVSQGSTDTSSALYVSPGIRWSYDFNNGLQIVPGVAFPIGLGPSGGEHGFLLYLSFEHPFRKTKP